MSAKPARASLCRRIAASLEQCIEHAHRLVVQKQIVRLYGVSYVHICTTHARVRRVREASASTTQIMAQARTSTCTLLQCALVHVSLHASVAALH
eukprot:254332-Pleurochrysis_carterae.AAC.2